MKQKTASFLKVNPIINDMPETITISKHEYVRLKRIEEIDHNLISQLVRSLEDIKAGRIKRVV